MHFRFAVELSDIDLWNIYLLETHSNLLDADIPGNYFVCLHNDKLQDMPSRRLQDQQMFAGICHATITLF